LSWLLEVLTEDISKAMDMVVENQISRAHDLVKATLRSRCQHCACPCSSDVIDRLEPFLKPAPFKDPINDRPAEITYFEVPDHRLVVEYPNITPTTSTFLTVRSDQNGLRHGPLPVRAHRCSPPGYPYWSEILY